MATLFKKEKSYKITNFYGVLVDEDYVDWLNECIEDNVGGFEPEVTIDELKALWNHSQYNYPTSHKKAFFLNGEPHSILDLALEFLENDLEPMRLATPEEENDLINTYTYTETVVQNNGGALGDLTSVGSLKS